MNKTKIEWCDYTWNPVTGCLHGCDYCYAKKIAERFGCHAISNNKIEKIINPWISDNDGRKLPYPYDFVPTMHKYRLDEPKEKTKGVKIFVSSMGDLFGEWVPHTWIDAVFEGAVMANNHTYMFLTKNPKRYKEELSKWNEKYNRASTSELPSTNKWLFGTTIENQVATNERVPELLNAFGVKRFLSIEPLLGPIDLSRIEPLNRDDVIIDALKGTAAVPFTVIENRPRIHWIIIGAQTGPGAVKPKKEWIESIINQAREANIPIFLKDNLNWPEKIQEYPEI